MVSYDKSHYYIDFSSRDNLSDAQKVALERIQLTYLPLERATFLVQYRLLSLITDDDYEKLTGIPYRCD